jgi:hypothetical protein
MGAAFGSRHKAAWVRVRRQAAISLRAPLSSYLTWLALATHRRNPQIDAHAKTPTNNPSLAGEALDSLPLLAAGRRPRSQRFAHQARGWLSGQRFQGTGSPSTIDHD